MVRCGAGFVDHSSDTHEDEEDDGRDSKKRDKKKRMPKSLKAKAQDKAQQARDAEKKKMQEELMDIEVRIKRSTSRQEEEKGRDRRTQGCLAGGGKNCEKCEWAFDEKLKFG